jgi:gliding motility-associated lipoprotein GldH
MRMSLALLLCIALLAGCDEKRVYDQSLPLEGGSWPAVEALHFEFDMEDTVALHNLYINLRNGEEYQYSNLFLFVELEFPNGKKSVDTLECPLADAFGNWYGSGLGSVYDQRILYRSRVQFPIRGHYRVNIFQAMREDELQGIHDVGFRIARAY